MITPRFKQESHWQELRKCILDLEMARAKVRAQMGVDALAATPVREHLGTQRQPHPMAAPVATPPAPRQGQATNLLALRRSGLA